MKTKTVFLLKIRLTDGKSVSQAFDTFAEAKEHRKALLKDYPTLHIGIFMVNSNSL